MSETKLTPLEVRKQLLIAESEMNRVLLAREYQALRDEVHEAVQPVRFLGDLAASVFEFMGNLKGPHGSNSAASNGFGWATWLFRMGMDLWAGFRGNKGEGGAKGETGHDHRHEVPTH